MNKITDPSYILPNVHALALFDQFEGSANKPLLIDGIETQSHERGEYVVKLRAAERLSNEAFQRELIAAFIAMELDIPCVQPAVITVSSDFVDTLKGDNSWQVANKSLGYNFGSKYMTGYNTIILGAPLSNEELKHAQNIFLFDLLIQNTDRTTTKPNMLSNSREIIILDHEIAFGFVLDIFPSIPGTFKETDLLWIKLHCLLDKVKNTNVDLDEFCNKIGRLDESFWERVWQLTPTEWASRDQFLKIRNFVLGILTQIDKFKVELKRIIS
ncbi:HipA family kinase [Chitinophaga eiseniae]|uniref:HipA-like kinase domain-containing protein n=1 Tax=Chitinophaga eiseniae TaxID=634771 RepID=A0A847SIQ6_9BACT|nr:HipA family kinase [Chitinophaga eiseniae]NLR77029.1 hypothetical protein [Chitinophaga eiseniae]